MANVLLINIRALGSEIAKNILLSGINSLTILDDGTVTEEEFSKNFLLDADSIGKKVGPKIIFNIKMLLKQHYKKNYNHSLNKLLVTFFLVTL